MEDNPTFNVKFVQIIAKYPVLYDYTLEGYSNRRVQEKTWNDIGKQVNETGVACKEKWKNLRCAYTRYLRQKALALVKKKYYLADYLGFLTPFTISRKQKESSPSAVNITEETSYSSSYDEITETKPLVSELESYESELHDESLENTNRVKESTTNDNMLIAEVSPTPKSYGTKRKDMDPLEDAIDDFNPKRRCLVDTNEDADMLFLKSLLPDLRQMSNAQKLEFKWKTIQNIGQILYKAPPDKMVPTNSTYTNYDSSHSSLHTHSAFSNNSQP